MAETREQELSGVQQRQWGKWVAEIRLPQNRAMVWLGTFDSPQAAACAYDIPACMLRGEYARLNFPDMENTRLRALRSSVEAKIQAVHQGIKRKKQKMKKDAERDPQNLSFSRAMEESCYSLARSRRVPSSTSATAIGSTWRTCGLPRHQISTRG